MIKTILVRTALVLFAVLVSPGLASGTKPLVSDEVPLSSDYILRSWDAYDGLPSNSVNGIAQTPNGYLWLATRRGIARFDGIRFTCYFKKDTSGLISDVVRSVFVAHDGSLWAGLERGGVVRFSNDHFQPIVLLVPVTEQTQWTSSFAEDAEGGVWFGYAPDLKVLRWQAGKLTSFSSEAGVGPGIDTYVYADVNGAIWFSTTQGCGIFDGRRFQRVEADAKAWIHMAPSRGGGMWATSGHLLLRYEPDGTPENIADLGDLSVSALLEDRAGDLWIGTHNQGLVRFHNGSFVRVPASHIPDQPAGAGPVKLAATSSSNAPVSYYVREGPAEVAQEGALTLLPIPPRAKYPVKVTVVATQWGRSIDPKLQTADPVEKTFSITAPSLSGTPEARV